MIASVTRSWMPCSFSKANDEASVGMLVADIGCTAGDGPLPVVPVPVPVPEDISEDDVRELGVVLGETLDAVVEDDVGVFIPEGEGDTEAFVLGLFGARTAADAW